MTTSNSNQSIPPFPPFPSVCRFVDLGATKDTIARVSRAINGGEALSLVIGPPGVGKTLVCNVLAQQFADSHDVVMLGEIPITDAASYYRAILHHLGVDYKSVPAGDLYVSLVDRISGEAMTRDGLLVIVDEAQLLAAEVLDAIRTTTNIMKNQQPCVSAVVCGGVKLEDTLASASMEPFTQRVATRCYLHPMNATETRQYIRDSIRACGSDPDATMTDEAMGAIHHACNGVPRLINQMMTEAIDCAAEAGQSLIDEKVVDRAWAVLQQLPSPMVDEQKIVHQGSPVEFGSLSELCEMPGITCHSKTAVQVGLDARSETHESTSVTSDVKNIAPEVTESEATEYSEDGMDEVADTCNESKLAALAAGPIEVSDADSNDSTQAETVVDEECLDEDFDEDFDEEIEEEAPRMRVFTAETDDDEDNCDSASEWCHEETVESTAVSHVENCDEETTHAVEKVAQVVADAPTYVSVEMTPATSQLFGEFDAEESLSVQETIQRKVATSSESVSIEVESVGTQSDEMHSASLTEETAPMEPAAQACSQEPPAELRQSQSIDFEASLHDEVLLLNEMATQARFGGIDAQNTFSEIQQPAASTFEEPPIWLMEEEVAASAAPQRPDPMARQDAMDRDMQSVTVDEHESLSFDDVQLVNDDSDLLIIEDELDVVPRPHVAGSQSKEQTVSVDFQAMLNKMRTGT
ncbi:MAG: AAA family ATPase [Pirellulaceae bacterium]